ncbi:MAG: T9SS type A sorting domain-containing protein, partial [bacterium]
DNPNHFRRGDRVFLRVLTRRGEETRSESFIIPDDDWLIDDLNFPQPLISTADEKLVPQDFSVSSPFPNPFNQRFRVDVTLPSTGLISLTFYDTEGRVVWQKKEFLSRGGHRLALEPSNLPSGVYLFQINWGDFARSFKMALVR